MIFLRLLAIGNDVSYYTLALISMIDWFFLLAFPG